MDSLLIQPITQPLKHTVKIPGSKSLTNRALLIASLANGETLLCNALFSDDSRYFASALRSLGFEIDSDEEKRDVKVHGLGGQIPANSAELFIGNAGTAARFLSAFLALGQGEYILDGDARMRERPLGDLVSSLRQLGATISSLSGQSVEKTAPPVRIIANGLPGGRTTVAGDVSSQFLSALLMVSPYAQSPVEIVVSTELNSKPYVDMTIRIMQEFGVQIRRDGYSRFSIQSGRYSAREVYEIEPDASAASYFFAAAALLGGTVRIPNITLQSLQGDVNFVRVLEQMGATILSDDSGLQVSRQPGVELRGVDVDMRDIPDTAQTLAAIAPFASSPTIIHGIASARVKESDRVSATCTELSRMGVQVEEFEDGMKIYPCQAIQPAEIHTYNDHRMAMAFSLAGLKVPGIRILDPGCVSKTFPEYFTVLETLR